MQLSYFKIFTDLVETKSFSNAAKLNGITKAAVSQQVRVIERHFKTQLIDRSQKRFQLTSAGSRVYEGAREFVRQYEMIARDLQEMKQIISGTIHISTIASIGLHVLPPYLRKFQQTYPSVNIQLLYRRTNLVYKDVLSNSADFGFVAFPVELPEIKITPFLDDQLVLITPPNHPLAHSSDVPLSALSGQMFIGLEPGGPAHDAISQIYRDNKIRIDTMIKFDNFETVIRAVEIGAGIALVPQFTAMQEIKRGSVVAVQFRGKKLIRPLAILYRKGRVLMPAMEKFIETLHMDLPRKAKA